MAKIKKTVIFKMGIFGTLWNIVEGFGTLWSGGLVCPLRLLKNHSIWYFSAGAMLRIKSNTLWDAFRSSYLSVRPSMCPYIYMTC